jgi:hypothetical protein
MLTSAYVSYCVGEASCLNRQAIVFSFHSIRFLYFLDTRNNKENENKRVYKEKEKEIDRGAERTNAFFFGFFASLMRPNTVRHMQTQRKGDEREMGAGFRV